MRNNILGGIAVVVIASATYIFFSGQAIAPITPLPIQPPSSSDKNTQVPELNRLTVQEQTAEKTVTIQSVVLNHSGFIAVHGEIENAPGPVVGVSALLSAGEHQLVQVAVNPTQKLEGTYFAMLHTDNGDGLYQFPGVDGPVKDSNGNIVMASFNVNGPSTIKAPFPLPTAPLTPEVSVETQAKTAVAISLIMKSGNFFFEPSQLKLKLGQPVTIQFTNSGFHNFTIDALGVNQQLSGANATVSFTPDKKGTFEFYCAIGSHRAMGMKGTVIVE